MNGIPTVIPLVGYEARYDILRLTVGTLILMDEVGVVVLVASTFPNTLDKPKFETVVGVTSAYCTGGPAMYGYTPLVEVIDVVVATADGPTKVPLSRPVPPLVVRVVPQRLDVAKT